MQDDDNFVKLVYRTNTRSFRTRTCILDMIIEKNGYNFSIVNYRSADVITDNNLTLILKLRERERQLPAHFLKMEKPSVKQGLSKLSLRMQKPDCLYVTDRIQADLLCQECRVCRLQHRNREILKLHMIISG